LTVASLKIFGSLLLSSKLGEQSITLHLVLAHRLPARDTLTTRKHQAQENQKQYEQSRWLMQYAYANRIALDRFGN
jgi:hypothetical protein